MYCDVWIISIHVSIFRYVHSMYGMFMYTWKGCRSVQLSLTTCLFFELSYFQVGAGVSKPLARSLPPPPKKRGHYCIILTNNTKENKNKSNNNQKSQTFCLFLPVVIILINVHVHVSPLKGSSSETPLFRSPSSPWPLVLNLYFNSETPGVQGPQALLA